MWVRCPACCVTLVSPLQDKPLVVSDMSALRRLTVLEFEFDSPGEGICDLTWVYQLPTSAD